MATIRLHPEYGVNPMLTLCFWCGGHDGVALLGHNKGKEAPREGIINYDPCKSCELIWSQGLVFIENTGSGNDHPFTGRFVVLKEEALPALGLPEDMAVQILKMRKGFVEPKAFDMLFGKLNEQG